jgi:hypothetical protein
MEGRTMNLPMPLGVWCKEETDILFFRNRGANEDQFTELKLLRLNPLLP